MDLDLGFKFKFYGVDIYIRCYNKLIDLQVYFISFMVYLVLGRFCLLNQIIIVLKRK